MKKAVVAAIVLVFVFTFCLWPASVQVGKKTVTLPQSKAYVVVENLIGDLSGFGRCRITGLSFFWAPYKALKYSSNRGVLFSNYAVDVLLKMEDQDEAYRIAQEAFDRLQESSRVGDTGNKLHYPLVIQAPAEVTFSFP